MPWWLTGWWALPCRPAAGVGTGVAGAGLGDRGRGRAGPTAGPAVGRRRGAGTGRAAQAGRPGAAARSVSDRLLHRCYVSPGAHNRLVGAIATMAACRSQQSRSGRGPGTVVRWYDPTAASALPPCYRYGNPAYSPELKAVLTHKTGLDGNGR